MLFSKDILVLINTKYIYLNENQVFSNTNVHRKHQSVGQDAFFKFIIKYNYITVLIICKTGSADHKAFSCIRNNMKMVRAHLHTYVPMSIERHIVYVCINPMKNTKKYVCFLPVW